MSEQNQELVDVLRPDQDDPTLLLQPEAEQLAAPTDLESQQWAGSQAVAEVVQSPGEVPALLEEDIVAYSSMLISDLEILLGAPVEIPDGPAELFVEDPAPPVEVVEPEDFRLTLAPEEGPLTVDTMTEQALAEEFDRVVTGIEFDDVEVAEPMPEADAPLESSLSLARELLTPEVEPRPESEIVAEPIVVDYDELITTLDEDETYRQYMGDVLSYELDGQATHLVPDVVPDAAMLELFAEPEVPSEPMIVPGAVIVPEVPAEQEPDEPQSKSFEAPRFQAVTAESISAEMAASLQFVLKLSGPDELHEHMLKRPQQDLAAKTYFAAQRAVQGVSDPVGLLALQAQLNDLVAQGHGGSMPAGQSVALPMLQSFIQQLLTLDD
ncbi:MAG: hypothetical protein JWN38_78 [Candidatus Saccharibacteria bacterium]|nr:hypothetical protein [Candidatus Saccharibacteria bacterium]